jgi:hypothetical protein
MQLLIAVLGQLMRIISVLNSMLISAGVGFNIVILRGRSKYKITSYFIDHPNFWKI